jgi:hypothetical protein
MMKKYYAVFIVLILTGSSLKAQDFVYYPSQHLVSSISDTALDVFQIDITTPSPEAITYKWDLISNTFPTEWECTLCDYQLCYFGIPNTSTMTPISLSDAMSGTIGYINISINTGSTYATGEVVIYVYDLLDINRGDTISFTISNINTTGVIEEENFTEAYIYPNPARNNVIISNPDDSPMTLTVYSALGLQIIAQELFPKETVNLKVDHLSRGLYYVSMTNSTGDQKTKRLVLQ